LETFKVGDVILDKYEVTRVLGKGGMGVVLAARRRELNDLVALKFLLPYLRDNPEISARFAEEARTGTRIINEHVARVYDVGNVDGVPFIVMEHLTGHDLSAAIRERGQLPIAESADLLLQACEGVNVAHALRVVHRDLKPGNLFVTTDLDGTPLVKVLDFGISKSIAPSDMSVTASTDVLGSPHYMSPEQFASGWPRARRDARRTRGASLAAGCDGRRTGDASLASSGDARRTRDASRATGGASRGVGGTP
jgi:serine/threonine-protein kinase